MIKVINVRNFIIFIAITTVAYYALKIIAAKQTMESMKECTREFRANHQFRSKLFTTETEAREFTTNLLECMDKKNGVAASLFFNKNESMKNFQFKNN